MGLAACSGLCNCLCISVLQALDFALLLGLISALWSSFFLIHAFLFQSCASFLGLDQWLCIWPECANAGLNGAGRSGKTLNFSYSLWKISAISYIWLLLQLITALCPVVSWGTQWVFTVFPPFLETFFSCHISYDAAPSPKSVSFLKKHRGWSFTSGSLMCEIFAINCIQLNKT